MDEVVFLEVGKWFTQTNGCIYEVLDINTVNGRYTARGLGHDGIFYENAEFGNVKDYDVLEGLRVSTLEEIEQALSKQ